LCLPVWFRSTNASQWQTGLSRSISTTGALIRADGPCLPCDELIVVIELPSATGCLVGRGRVIRVANAQDETGLLTFAVHVPRYRLERCDALLPHVSSNRRLAAG
jgi:hypothetical protein